MFKDNKALYTFMGKGAALALLWFLLLAPAVNDEGGGINRAVTKNLAIAGTGILQAFGMDLTHTELAHIVSEDIIPAGMNKQEALFRTDVDNVEGNEDWVIYNAITYEGRHILRIESACNGLVLMMLFAGFIIAFPGPWKHKLWFIPLGIVIIHVVNILRVAALGWNYVSASRSFEFNHKYTFELVVYCVIFLMWMWWSNQYANLKRNNTPKAAVAAA